MSSGMNEGREPFKEPVLLDLIFMLLTIDLDDPFSASPGYF